jgi:hypothetical protein
MTSQHDKLAEVMRAAIPASGFRPETEHEWRLLQRASILFAIQMFQENGLPMHQARRLAHQIYGGPIGRCLLEMAFADSCVEGAS